MYNVQNAQKTVMELRDVMSLLRLATPADVNFEALEIVLGHSLVDLSLAVELINQLAKENEELRSQSEDEEGPREEPDN